jgi:pimeloyl-ACP methyl ester carboxylesterase
MKEPRNMLIDSSTVLLGSCLAGVRLAFSNDTVYYATAPTEALSSEEITNLISQTARRVMPEGDRKNAERLIESRLHTFACNPAEFESRLASNIRIDEVWRVSGDPHLRRGRGLRSDAVMTRNLLAALPALGASEFNYVAHSFAGSESDVECEVVQQCVGLGLCYRIFRTGLIFPEYPETVRAVDEGFLQFLLVLDSLKNEIEERLPEYFDYQALRFWAPAGARLNLTAVEAAAKSMLRIAQGGGSAGRRFGIADSRSVPVAELCDQVGEVYDVSLLAVEDRRELNAIDRLFNERLKPFQSHFVSGEQSSDQAYLIANAEPQPELEFIRSFRSLQQLARKADHERLAHLPTMFEHKTITREGSLLTYYAGGSVGPPLILLNAIGQGTHYWCRLMDKLQRRRRVIIWESSRLDSPRPFRINDHVDDLEAVLKHEGASACYLIGWCTGPAVALEFYRRRPAAVVAMVFLNGAFKWCTGGAELDTPYARNLESLCRVLDQRPDMASAVRRSLCSNVENGFQLDQEKQAEQVATDVLSLMNRDLRPHVLAPFSSDTSLVNYSRQLLDFWSYEGKSTAERTSVPVLVISSEYDNIASPAMSTVAARSLPNARHVQVQGATHYCLYDRPDLIANLITDFFDETGALDQEDGEVKFKPDV